MESFQHTHRDIHTHTKQKQTKVYRMQFLPLLSSVGIGSNFTFNTNTSSMYPKFYISQTADSIVLLQKTEVGM